MDVSMRLARRVEQLPPYLFARISEMIAAKRAAGVDVISLGIGDPDIPTPSYLIDVLKAAAEKPANHRYPESDGLPALRQAIARWYQTRHGVTLDPNKEVVPLIGSNYHFSDTPVDDTRPPPSLGEHTDRVLREVAGVSDAELATLRGNKIIG